MNECEFHEQCEKCVGASILGKKYAEKRCPQCVLENNLGICDRKECGNYHTPNELVETAKNGIVTVQNTLTVGKKILVKSGFVEQCADEAMEALRPVFIHLDRVLHHQIQKARQEWLRSEIEKLEGVTPSMNVDEYVAIIKAGNWDKMYDAGVKATKDPIITRYKEELKVLESK